MASSIIIASMQPANSLLSSVFIFMVSLFFVRYPYHVGKTTQKGVFFDDRDSRALGLRHRAVLQCFQWFLKIVLGLFLCGLRGGFLAKGFGGLGRLFYLVGGFAFPAS